MSNHDETPSEIPDSMKPHVLHALRTSSLPAGMVERLVAEFALEDAPPLQPSPPCEDPAATPCH